MCGEAGDIFVIVDGVKIAKRGRPDTPQARTWVSLEPGWAVRAIGRWPEITGVEITIMASEFNNETVRAFSGLGRRRDGRSTRVRGELMASVWYWRIGIAIVLVVLWWITRNNTHMVGCC
jgi:hypothetical protein